MNPVTNIKEIIFNLGMKNYHMKKIFILFSLILFTSQTALSAEKIPVKITPAELISTHHDEVEVGDYFKFKVTDDVYVNDRLYISKGAAVAGLVSSLHENGYFFDNAEITFNPFKVRTDDGKVITINSTLVLNRKDFVCKTFGDKIVKYVGVAFRGNEIKVEPNSTEYNIFLIK